mmetsp:Transcript_1920/g.2796  ORF Transcript_1920/g.2796 Transcript_1920/m.2796 type:complete len:143 (+) Transcript_1920:23-451(+)
MYILLQDDHKKTIMKFFNRTPSTPFLTSDSCSSLSSDHSRQETSHGTCSFSTSMKTFTVVDMDRKTKQEHNVQQEELVEGRWSSFINAVKQSCNYNGRKKNKSIKNSNNDLGKYAWDDDLRSLNAHCYGGTRQYEYSMWCRR